MTDKDFIDKLNDIIFNYGYIIVNLENFDYYLDRYKIYSHLKNPYRTYPYYRFVVYNIKNDNFRLSFENIDKMINDTGEDWTIFIAIEMDNKCSVNWFSKEFRDFMMSIKGNNKVEICLKIQMMGY